MDPIIATGATVAIAAAISGSLIWLLLPWLIRHLTARPNARSSHHHPTPQGGGVCVVVGTLATAWAAVLLFLTVSSDQFLQFLSLTVAAAMLAVVGAIDDLRNLSAPSRLVLQGIAVAAIIAALPHDLQILPQLPWWIERFCLFLGGLWFVNLVNFMDGIDWMTVAEIVPVTTAIVLLGLCGEV